MLHREMGRSVAAADADRRAAMECNYFFSARRFDKYCIVRYFN